jgi:uncharacterized protein (TIGR02145 family)
MKNVYCLIGFSFLFFCACDVVEKKDLELITDSEPIVVKVDSVELLDSVPHVKIGVQVWMSNNVASTTFSDGREIKKVKSVKDWIKYNERKTPCCYVMKNGEVLYNGYVLLDSISICPKGYRLPIADDYLMLAAYLGGREKFTEKVMTKLAKYDWSVEDWNEAEQSLYERKVVGNNQSGFGANKGSYLFNGELDDATCSFYWVDTPIDSTNTGLKALYIGHCQADLEQGIGNFALDNGFSIRCIRK